MTKFKNNFFLTVLAFIFFFSGFSSLIYQVVWQRILTLYYGVGAVSVVLIVSVYMLGLGCGALYGGYLAERSGRPLRIYGWIELFLGFFGLISIPFIQMLGRSTAGCPYIISFIFEFIFLCFPTFLMGMTLPLLVKAYNRHAQDFIVSVSVLYFINTLGASAGALCAGYGIISFFGLDSGIYSAVVINFFLAGAILWLDRQPSSAKKEAAARDDLSHTGVLSETKVYTSVLLTGFLAIGYEIIWYRIIGVLVKSSPYAFCSILSVYLLGIALGSLGVQLFLRCYPRIHKGELFFFLQFLLGLTVMATFCGYYYLSADHPLRGLAELSFSFMLHPNPVPFTMDSLQEWMTRMYLWFDVFFWSAVFMLPAAVLMGASFPLIASLALKRSDHEGATVGRVYFVNILGNVLGGIVTGLVLLPLFKTEGTLLLFSVTGLCFGFVIVGRRTQTMARLRRAMVAVLIVANILLFPVSPRLYEQLHFAPTPGVQAYFEEGINGTVMTYAHGEHVWNYINGSSHGGRPVPIFYYETIEALSFAAQAQDVLIIGYGTGSVAEVVLKSERAQRVTIVELDEALIKNLVKMPLFKDMLADPRVELIIDDGRRFLLSTDKRFDLILIDPLRTTTAYSNNIYSREFFELCRRHMDPDGVLMVWTDEFYVLPKTLAAAFEHVRLYNQFCLASGAPFAEKDGEREHLLGRFNPNQRAGITQSGRYIGDQQVIREVTRYYPMNRDLKPYSEYYLGLKFRFYPEAL